MLHCLYKVVQNYVDIELLVLLSSSVGLVPGLNHTRGSRFDSRWRMLIRTILEGRSSTPAWGLPVRLPLEDAGSNPIRGSLARFPLGVPRFESHSGSHDFNGAETTSSTAE